MNAVELKLFASRIAAICDEMGVVLRRAAFSPNIKDRLDFSCALFGQALQLHGPCSACASRATPRDKIDLHGSSKGIGDLSSGRSRLFVMPSLAFTVRCAHGFPQGCAVLPPWREPLVHEVRNSVAIFSPSGLSCHSHCRLPPRCVDIKPLRVCCQVWPVL